MAQMSVHVNTVIGIGFIGIGIRNIGLVYSFGLHFMLLPILYSAYCKKETTSWSIYQSKYCKTWTIAPLSSDPVQFTGYI